MCYLRTENRSYGCPKFSTESEYYQKKKLKGIKSKTGSAEYKPICHNLKLSDNRGQT